MNDLEALQKMLAQDEDKPQHTFWKRDKDNPRAFQLIDMYTGDVVTTYGDSLNQCPTVIYTPEIGRLVCELLRDGHKLRDICERAGMPERSLIYLWRKNYPDFAQLMDESRRDAADKYFEDALVVAEACDNKDAVPAAKLKVDTYKWAAEKANPKRYGAKVEVDAKHSGGVGFYVVSTGINRDAVPVKPVKPEPVEADAVVKETIDSDAEKA